jgi:hypothetical protein
MAFSSIGLFIDSRPRLQGQGSVFIFDGLISEDHRREWTWTSEPVEDGTTVSDNRWRKPVPLTIVAIVSSSEALAIDRSRLGDYRNMGIQSVSVPVTAATGNSMQSTIVLKPIFVQFTAVAANLADAAQDSGQAEVDLGNQGFAAPA